VVGLKVEAKIDGEYYPGAIASCPPDGDSVFIEFDDGDKENVDVDDIKLPKSNPGGSSKKSKKTGSKSKEDKWDEDDNWDD